MADTIHSFNVLSYEEAGAVREMVLRLKTHWLPYGGDPQHPYFYTLGAASYLHVDETEKYLSSVRDKNLILREHFAWLHKRLIESLSFRFSERFALAENIALPGFHIYPGPMPNGGTVHSDFQSQTLKWPEPDVLDLKKTGSMTLAIELPHTGSGLRYWPKANQREKGPMFFQEYQKGICYYFSGPLLHQIAPNPEKRVGEYRITLQAHTMWHRDGFWLVYW